MSYLFSKQDPTEVATRTACSKLSNNAALMVSELAREPAQGLMHVVVSVCLSLTSCVRELFGPVVFQVPVSTACSACSAAHTTCPHIRAQLHESFPSTARMAATGYPLYSSAYNIVGQNQRHTAWCCCRADPCPAQHPNTVGHPPSTGGSSSTAAGAHTDTGSGNLHCIQAGLCNPAQLHWAMGLKQHSCRCAAAYTHKTRQSGPSALGNGIVAAQLQVRGRIVRKTGPSGTTAMGDGAVAV
jgi:hypothetical protein